MSKLVTRRVRRGKHVKRMKRGKRSRCGGNYSKRKGYSKHKKHYTRKYGRLTRTRTRTKRGGVNNPLEKPRKFTLNYHPQIKFHDRVLGEGYVLVTKLNDKGETAWNAHEDDLQQMAILQKNDPVFGLQNFRIFKCRGEECDNVSEMSTNKFSVNRDASKKVLNITFSTLSTPSIKYRLKLMPDEELSTLNFFFEYYNTRSEPVVGQEKESPTKPDVETGALIDEDAEAAAEAEAQNSRVIFKNSKEAFDAAQAAYENDLKQFEKSKIKTDRIVDKIDNLSIDDIKYMLKKIEESSEKRLCLFLCNPDTCNQEMLEKIRKKFIQEATNYMIDRERPLDLNSEGYIALSGMLNDSLLLVLENLCVEYNDSKTKHNGNFTTIMSKCDSRILSLFKNNNRLHTILKIFYISILTNLRSSQPELDIYVKNMETLIQILNGLDMAELESVLNSITAENIQKLSDFLKTISPASLSDILQNIDRSKILEILQNYTTLNRESMDQLLELYSSTEKTQDNKVLIHRYPNGVTPLSQKLVRNRKHKYATCKSVQELNTEVGYFSKPKFIKDKEFQQVVQECESYPPTPPPGLITGGGRRRKTLKKKRRPVNKR